MDTDGRADWRRPLERGLDLSPQGVPLFRAERGLVLRVCSIGYNRAAEIALLRGEYVLF